MFDPISPALLEAIIDELDPHSAGQLLDILAKLGVLPPSGTDPDARIAFTVRDQAPPRLPGWREALVAVAS